MTHLSTIQLEDNEYCRLSSFIQNQFGIKLPPNKKTLLQCRLQKRLRSLKLGSFREYVDYLFANPGHKEEIWNMIDAVSTNKTDFFRESIHFEYLMNNGIGQYLEYSRKNKLSVWSAGCSSGEEPYTISMVLSEFASTIKKFDFSILASDIAESVLGTAIEGIYSTDKTNIIPLEYQKKYLLRGKNGYSNQVRIINDLRSKITFIKYNLLSTDYSSLGQFDIIFCRNVLIYFERDVQSRILKQFCKVLNPGGFLFLGHSESITGLTLPLKHIRPTVFQKEIECRSII